jgi:hypothetical protein
LIIIGQALKYKNKREKLTMNYIDKLLSIAKHEKKVKYSAYRACK